MPLLSQINIIDSNPYKTVEILIFIFLGIATNANDLLD